MDDEKNQRPESSSGASVNGAPSSRTPRKSILNKVISRRNSREWALQMLFRLDVASPETTLDDFFSEFWALQFDVLEEFKETDSAALEEFKKPTNNQYRSFAEKLVRGVWNNLGEIDSKIEGYLTNWTLPRMGGVDRNVLRIAFYELFFAEDTPPIVIINEAIDIAKYFSTRESGKFVNGVLDRAKRDVSRNAREATRPLRRSKKQ